LEARPVCLLLLDYAVKETMILFQNCSDVSKTVLKETELMRFLKEMDLKSISILLFGNSLPDVLNYQFHIRCFLIFDHLVLYS